MLDAVPMTMPLHDPAPARIVTPMACRGIRYRSGHGDCTQCQLRYLEPCFMQDTRCTKSEGLTRPWPCPAYPHGPRMRPFSAGTTNAEPILHALTENLYISSQTVLKMIVSATAAVL